MTSRLLRFALLGAFLTWSTGTAIAEETAQSSTYAVIVGVGEFKDPQIKPRPTAVADAQAVFDLITDTKYLGVDPANVHLLLSGKDAKRPAKDATKANILTALGEVAKKAGKDDKIILFIASQGASAGERTVIFADDTSFKDRSKTAIISTEIAEKFKNLKSEQLLALVDINFKGFDAGKETVVEPKLGDLMLGFFGIEKEDDQNLPNGRAVILASNSPSSLDLEKHGVFTTTLVEALQGAADEEGGEADGFITVDELQTYLDKNQPNLTRKFGKTREEKEQVPFAINRAAHFAVTKNPPVYAKVEARLAKLAQLDRDQKVNKEVAEEGKKLLSRMPKLKALRELRKSYELFIDGQLPETEFLAKRTTILDGMKIDTTEAKTFAKKVMDGIDMVTENYIKELNRGELVNNAITGMYKRLEVKVPAEIEEKLKTAKTLRKSELVELLIEARTALGKREDLEKNKDVDIALATTLTKLDPYTNYMDKESLDRLASQLKGEFTGIGVQIRRDLVRDGLLVVTPIKGSPAYKAGIKAGDLITKIVRPVDNAGDPIVPPEEISTKGMKVDEAVKKILGKPGTAITVYVEREGVAEPMKFELKRNRVEVESVLGWKRKTNDDWDFYIDPKNQIGYIHLTQFARRSDVDLASAVAQLEKQGVKGLILDLRFNPGGYLDVAVRICDLFIDDGLIVTIKPRVGEEKSFTGRTEPSKLNFPMVVLVNGSSASGSEIVSACLQDHDRAVVMGERSYGKGSVQNIAPFGQTGGEIKMTTATFWRPNGKNLNKSSLDLNKLSPQEIESSDWGVRPSKEYNIELSPQERGELEGAFRDREIIGAPEAKPEKKEFKDRQLDAALDYLRSQIKATASNTIGK